MKSFGVREVAECLPVSVLDRIQLASANSHIKAVAQTLIRKHTGNWLTGSLRKVNIAKIGDSVTLDGAWKPSIYPENWILIETFDNNE